MKKLLLTLIVFLAFGGSIFAQYESHWPGFYDPDFEDQSPLVAAIVIDGEIVTAENHPDNWNALEIAFFYGDESRGTGFYLYNGYVEDYGDPFPVIDGVPVYFNTADQAITVKMYDHVNNIEYNECSVTYLGEPYTILTGGDHTQGWFDPENPIMLNFTTPASDCKIRLDADQTEWIEDFEDDSEVTDDPFTGDLPECWTVVNMYTHALNGNDTLPQVYYNPTFNTTEGGSYTLRMKFRSLLAMPELDENVDLGKVRLSMNVRQPFWSYKLQIGVMTDLENEESFVPVAVVNNSTKNMTYFECGFESVSDLVGPGRYIVFKNIGGTEGDLYCSNYIDDIKLSYITEECDMTLDNLPYTENFEDYTTLLGETGVEPDCWSVITEDAALESVTKPQLYSNFNTTPGGQYTLRMKNRCVYAMPKLEVATPTSEGSSDLVMTLKVRQPNSLYRLQVGVVDEQNVFTPVQTIKCTSTEMQEFTVTIPAFTSGRIAFRNTLVPGNGMATDYLDYSYNYIDDITLDLLDQNRSSENVNDVMDANAALDNISVYPNPTTGNLYIDAMGIQKVECYNQMGQLVRVYDNVRNSIDMNNLSEGVYTLRITVPQGVTMRKVVKK